MLAQIPMFILVTMVRQYIQDMPVPLERFRLSRQPQTGHADAERLLPECSKISGLLAAPIQYQFLLIKLAPI